MMTTSGITEAWPSSLPHPKSVPARKWLHMSWALRFSSLQSVTFLSRGQMLCELWLPPSRAPFGIDVSAVLESWVCFSVSLSTLSSLCAQGPFSLRLAIGFGQWFWGRGPTCGISVSWLLPALKPWFLLMQLPAGLWKPPAAEPFGLPGALSPAVLHPPLWISFIWPTSTSRRRWWLRW